MAPGALTEIPAMVNTDWDIIVWDEFVNGIIPRQLIQSPNLDLVGITFLTPSRYRAIELGKHLTDLNKPVIAGGRDIIGWSRETDGENQILKFFPSFCSTKLTPDLLGEILNDSISGGLKSHYQLAKGETSSMVLPRHDLIDSAKYIAGSVLRSSEGCNRLCDWCTVGGVKQIFKDPAIVQLELELCTGRFFVDAADSFAGNPDYLVNELLPLYAKSGKKWAAEIQVSHALELKTGQSLIELMAQSGCKVLYFGIESVTRSLNSNKSSRENAEQAILLCRKAGIFTIGALILDMFGDETISEIEDTIKWATLWLDFTQFSLLALLPGSVSRRNALRDNLIINQGHENWRDYDGSHPTIKHDLSPEVRRGLWRKAYLDFSRLDHVFMRSLGTRSIIEKLGLIGASLRYRQAIPKK